MPRFAAIDVGSNALRLRIVDAAGPSPSSISARPPASSNGGALANLPPASGDGTAGTSPMEPSGWREVLALRAAVRLGAEVFAHGHLSSSSIGQACAAFKQFREAMDNASVTAYRATATSAVREASNGATLVERARREAGIELEVIEGVEEARLIQLAVTRRVKLAQRRALLIDVGGGSTELTILEAGQSTFSASLPMGTVRLLEAFLKDEATGHSGTIDRARGRLLAEQVDRSLAEVEDELVRGPFDILLGTGGNIETLADLAPTRGGFAGHPRAIDVAQGKKLLATLLPMTPHERREAYGLRPDRADTIVPAAMIFLRLAELLHAPCIVAPGVGLKEGILEELVDKHFHVWDTEGETRSVLAACARLGRRYAFDEAHGELVARLAAQLFDDLQTVHRFGERERLLLRAAAVLHDVGDFVRYDGHHKHSYYLIQHSDIMGLSAEERAVVANVARYHRKSTPDPSHPNFRDLDKDARSKVRGLAAILRIADALDREHLGKVHGVRGVLDSNGRKLSLVVTGREDRELEEWTVNAKADLLKEAFGLDLVVLPEIKLPDPPVPKSQRPLLA